MIKHLKFAAVLGATCAVFGLSGQAHATNPYSCSNSTYGSSYGTYSNCSGTNVQASTISTSTAVLATAAMSAANLVSDRVSSAVGGDGGFRMAANGFAASTGQSAGGHSGMIGAWVGGSWRNAEDDNVSTAFDGDVFNVMGGVDYRIMPKAVIGISVGYEDVDFDTTYNGFGGVDGNVDGQGYTIAPYIGGEIAPDVSANLTIGYSDLEYDTVRYDPLTGNSIVGSTDSNRYFVDASVRGHHMLDANWRLRGKASVFYASEDRDAFTETESNGATITQASYDNDFGQLGLEGRLGYLYQQVEPYALVGVSYDFAKDEAPVGSAQSRSSLDDEDFAAKFGAGIDLRLGHNVKAGIEGYTVEFRDDYDEYAVTGGLRVDF